MLTVNLAIIKYIIIIISIVLLAFYIVTLNNELIVIKSNNSTLKESIVTQRKTIEIQDKKIKNSILLYKEMIKIKNVQISEQTALNAKLSSKHDFDEIALKKKKLLEKIINRASKNVARCFELVTGSYPKKGETNNECNETINHINSNTVSK